MLSWIISLWEESALDCYVYLATFLLALPALEVFSGLDEQNLPNCNQLLLAFIVNENPLYSFDIYLSAVRISLQYGSNRSDVM
jgi:hypothetical protein